LLRLFVIGVIIYVRRACRFNGFRCFGINQRPRSSVKGGMSLLRPGFGDWMHSTFPPLTRKTTFLGDFVIHIARRSAGPDILSFRNPCIFRVAEPLEQNGDMWLVLIVVVPISNSALESLHTD
jgi:hypothetical protein